MKSLQILILICIANNDKLPDNIALHKLVFAINALLDKQLISKGNDSELGYSLTELGRSKYVNILSLL